MHVKAFIRCRARSSVGHCLQADDIRRKSKIAPSLLICNARYAANIQHRFWPANMSSSLVKSFALLYRGKQMIRCQGGGDLRPTPALGWRRAFAASGAQRGPNEDFLT